MVYNIAHWYIMRCIIPGGNVKAFGRAIHCIAKIGDDLYVDPQVDGLALRSMNSSRSAFVSFLFNPSFFSMYDEKFHDPEDSRVEDDDEEGSSKCKVSMKAILMAFRSINVLDKTVESCLLRILANDAKLKVELRCRHSITKTYTLPFIECESLKATCDSSQCGNRLTAEARVLTDAVLNFLRNQEEVTMSVTESGKFVMKTYIEGEEEFNKLAVHTELTMQPSEFQSWQVQQDSTVTYCLKELRAIIAFADAFSLPLEASFDTPGSPVVFSLKNPDLMEAALVMATLASDTNNQLETTTHASNVSRISERPTTESQNSNVSSVLKRPAEVTFNTCYGDDETPQSKKARFLFKRCFDATFNMAAVPGNEKVLAPDSEDEEIF